MATLDLDPLFVKALRLLRSKSKDSVAQLKNMLDDAIALKTGHKPFSTEGESSAESKSEKESSRKKESEKRSFEKFSHSLDPTSSDVKRPRRDSPTPMERENTKSTSEKEREKEKEKEKHRREKEIKEKDRKDKERKEKDKEKEKEDKVKKEQTTEADGSEGEQRSMDADDFAFDLGISCVVCRQFGVSSGNRLVECQDCHSLYHQECHRPPVTEQEVNDPRFVWYCTRCSKSLKKAQVPKPTKPKSSLPGTVNKEPSPSFSKASKSKTDTSPTSSLPFRRADTTTQSSKELTSSKSVSNKDTGGSRPLSGLVSLAANLAGKSENVKPKSTENSKKMEKSSSSKVDVAKHASKSDQTEKNVGSSTSKSKSSTSTKHSSFSRQASNSGVLSSSTGVSADKRLHMKKKASAKLHDKKVHVK